MGKEIPHGHGLSYKKGVSDSLQESKDYDRSSVPELPNGHNESYRRGRIHGDELRKEINSRVKSSP